MAQDSKATEAIKRPEYFKGKAGIETVAGSAKFVNSGTVLKGKDVFLEYNVMHTRTGVLMNDLSFKAGGGQIFDGAETVPAGTLMYAGHFGDTYNIESKRHAGGLAWCAIRTDTEQPLCIFWDGSRRTPWSSNYGKAVKSAAYVEGSSAYSRYYIPKFSIKMIDGGTIPIIEEKPVDFGRDLTVKLRFDKFKKDRVLFSAKFTDGDKEFDYDQHMLTRMRGMPLNDQGEAKFQIFDKWVKITKLGKKEARFEIVEP